MNIDRVHESPDLLTVHATIGGQQFEFAAWRGGAFEVYDYPKARRGIARHLGYLPEATAGHLVCVLRRKRLLKASGGYFYHGLPCWVRTPSGPYCAAPERSDGRPYNRVSAPIQGTLDALDRAEEEAGKNLF